MHDFLRKIRLVTLEGAVSQIYYGPCCILLYCTDLVTTSVNYGCSHKFND